MTLRATHLYTSSSLLALFARMILSSWSRRSSSIYAGVGCTILVE